MSVLSTKVVYYVAKKTKQSESEKISPMYYDTVSQVYSPMSSYEYATPYLTQQEAEKRAVILNMLAQLETIKETEIKYMTIKRTETIEEITEEI